MRSLAWLPLALLLGGCPQLSNLGLNNPTGVTAPPPPRITVSGVTLVQSPSAQTIARALCPRVANQVVCYALGGMPSANELRFVFDVALDVQNQAQIALPVVEALAAFTVFPAAQGAQNLGAVCLQMCQAGAADCHPDNPSGCRTGGANIRTAEDFRNAAVSFLVNAAFNGPALDSLRIKTIPAGGTIRVTFRLALEPQVMLDILGQLAQSAVDQIKRGSTPQFLIPYRVEGSVWVDVQNFGRIGAGFGPYDGEWPIR